MRNFAVWLILQRGIDDARCCIKSEQRKAVLSDVCGGIPYGGKGGGTMVFFFSFENGVGGQHEIQFTNNTLGTIFFQNMAYYLLLLF